MAKRIGVLVIHGMGSHRPGYSAEMVGEIARRLGALETRVAWEEIHWAYILKDREDVVWKSLQSAQQHDGTPLWLDWIKLRQFVLHNFGDAIAYQRGTGDESAYTLIHNVISANLKALKASLADPKAPIIVLAKSLGAHIISNYIWDRQHGDKIDSLESVDNLVGVITMGCQIALFSLSFPFARPIILPGSGIKKKGLKEVAAWLNFFDRDDVLGWPVRPVYEKNFRKLTAAEKHTVKIIQEHEVNVGSLLTAWNPATHLGYGTDDDVTKPVAVYLKSVISAL